MTFLVFGDVFGRRLVVSLQNRFWDIHTSNGFCGEEFFQHRLV
jgi:hypothetical protein